MSDKENIKAIINLCWDAVNESNCGPFFYKEGEVTKVNNTSLQTFITVLSNVLPKNLQSLEVKPREPWQE